MRDEHAGMNPFALIGCAMALAQPTPAAPQLDVDPATGAWNALRLGTRNLLAAPAAEADIAWNSDKLPPADQWKLLDTKREGATVTVVRQAGPWRVTTVLTAGPDATIRRTVRFAWQGPGVATVWNTALRVPPLRLSASPSDWYCLPGNFPVEKRRFDALRPGAVARESGWTRGDYALAMLHSPSAKLSAFVSYEFGRDQAGVSAEETNGGVCVVHRFDTVAKMQPGREIECGTQVIRLFTGDEAAAMGALGRFSDSIGNGPPADQPEHLKKMILCEVHPWGRLEAWGAGDRGHRYSRLTALLPYYKKLGVTALWLLPVSWPPPWVYTLPAFDRVAPENGSEAELKELVAAGHRAGIKTLIDLVVYGILPSSDEVKRLPNEVWCKDEAGQPVKVWGGTVLAADCSNPIWQKRIAEVVRHWAADFGFDGTRMDCIGWGQTVNWANTERVNAPIGYGGLQLNKVVRDTMRAANPDSVTLPEGGKPLVFRNSDLVFDYPLYLAMRDMTQRPDLDGWIRDLRVWLEFERRCYPSRAGKGLVRFMELHDTVSAAEYFGVGPSQALMAICTFIQGTPLLQQEQETGFSDDLASWFKLRNQLKCFYAGEADYLAVKCSAPGVFAFLRKSSGQTAVVAVNLTGAPVRGKLAWPADLAASLPIVSDVFGSAALTASTAPGAATVTVPPYRPVVLLLQRRGTKPVDGHAALARKQAPAPAPNAEGQVALGEMARWFVETPEGRLDDVFTAQQAKVHAGEPVEAILPVLRRAWTPLTSGLLDGASQAAIGVVGKDGGQMRWAFDPRTATDVRIADPDADGKAVTLTVKHGSAPAPAMPDGVKVTPHFVEVPLGAYRLVLARRHGGVPVALAGRDGRSLIQPGGDFYTDWGIIPNRVFVSADGNTNPRFTIDSDAEATTVTFRGELRSRAWNGVSTCGIAGPSTACRLTYRCERATGKLTMTLAITPGADLPQASAFLALRLPLPGPAALVRNGQTEPISQTPGQRLASGEPLRLVLPGGTLETPGVGELQNSFVIGNPDGSGAVFLCALDGKPIDLKQGREYAASVVVTVGASAR